MAKIKVPVRPGVIRKIGAKGLKLRLKPDKTRARRKGYPPYQPPEEK